MKKAVNWITLFAHGGETLKNISPWAHNYLQLQSHVPLACSETWTDREVYNTRILPRMEFWLSMRFG